jgi:hypothetical protein
LELERDRRSPQALAKPRWCRLSFAHPLGDIVMNRFNRIAAVAVLLSFAGNAVAADQKEKDKSEGRICTMESVVGSHMPKRVCTTAAEREAVRNSSQQHVGEMQNYANRTGIASPGRN